MPRAAMLARPKPWEPCRTLYSERVDLTCGDGRGVLSILVQEKQRSWLAGGTPALPGVAAERSPAFSWRDG
jgi:hypothetical protein